MRDDNIRIRGRKVPNPTVSISFHYLLIYLRKKLRTANASQQISQSLHCHINSTHPRQWYTSPVVALKRAVGTLVFARRAICRFVRAVRAVDITIAEEIGRYALFLVVTYVIPWRACFCRWIEEERASKICVGPRIGALLTAMQLRLVAVIAAIIVSVADIIMVDAHVGIFALYLLNRNSLSS